MKLLEIESGLSGEKEHIIGLISLKISKISPMKDDRFTPWLVHIYVE